MIVLAFDPGKTIGCALVDFSFTPRPLIRATSALTETEIAHTLATELHCADRENFIVAVEVNETYATRERDFNPVHLVRAGRIAGEIIGHARALGARVVTFSAHEWRRAIVGSRTPTDAQIKATIARLVDISKRSNNHERDAIGVALYAERLTRLGIAQRDLKPENMPKPWRPKRRKCA